ncbi:hypothetical protein SCOCK_200166 [Actinacidiphila cocklensis]|uniref:Uncharacterized protein n=1 Tax=Actinacidiphila cocklensis TaxID=887465 RepID=A0A9W4DP92_9ACTN|nr:hypothetical protein SCOCK_200166 [Actinacidiphila cocklensis]
MGAGDRPRLAGVRHDHAGGRRGQDPHRQRRPAVLQPHHRPADRQAAAGRQRGDHAERQGAEGRLRRARQQEGRRRRAGPGHRGDPRHGEHPVVRPVGHRGLLQHRREELDRAGQEERSGRPVPEPGAAPDLPARFDVQAGHGGRGTGVGQGDRRRRQDDVARPVHPARHHGAAEERGPHPVQGRHTAQCAAAVLQHRLRQARRRHRAQGHGRRGGEVRLQQGAARPRPRRREQLRHQDEPRPGRPVLDRPVRHRGHPAADGHGRLGDRQQRGADAALRGREAGGAQSEHHLADRPHGAEQAADAGERAEAAVDDGDGRHGRHRQERQDPGRQGRRQDRYRAARRQQRQGALRLVRLLRHDRPGLAGRGGRGRRGRLGQPRGHQRRRPGGPDRQGRHGSGARQVTGAVTPPGAPGETNVTRVVAPGHIPVGYRRTSRARIGRERPVP